MNEQHASIHRLLHAQADQIYILHCFGDFIAKREGYKANSGGIEAVHYYLMQKHDWTPAQLRTMDPQDLHFALSEEMQGWILPPGARP